MTKKLLALALCLLLALAQVHAQPSPQSFSSFQAWRDTLLQLALQSTDAAGRAKLDAFWSAMRQARRIPFAIGDSVGFLYRGNASSVRWNGDFNSWGNASQIRNSGSLLPNSDIWLLEHALPSDARIDYKIVLNGSTWILDPNNPLTQMSGFGPNSELRMPNYRPSPDVVLRTAQRGSLSENQRIQSARLGYAVQYRVYTPFAYNAASAQPMPTIYVTDGHEYANDAMGSMVIVLDNLIAEQRIQPVIAVFIDPRNPDNLSQNRRAVELVTNANYLRFVTEELVPRIDSLYRTVRCAEQRAILGTSLGGLNAAYFGLNASQTFGLIAMQSPALWAAPSVAAEYQQRARLPLKFFLSTGTLFDGENNTRAFRRTLEEKGYPVRYREVNEGHSWGNWRALLSEMLTYFFAATSSVRESDGALPKEFRLEQNYPNPFNPTTTITYTLPKRSKVSLKVFDVLGREVATLVNQVQEVGAYRAYFSAHGLTSGVYFYQLRADEFSQTRKMTLLK
ncbi:MAG: alpha/beta hydrolase-fold protein [Candidatus Thermochlorobacter sp.]